MCLCSFDILYGQNSDYYDESCVKLFFCFKFNLHNILNSRVYISIFAYRIEHTHNYLNIHMIVTRTVYMPIDFGK